MTAKMCLSIHQPHKNRSKEKYSLWCAPHKIKSRLSSDTLKSFSGPQKPTHRQNPCSFTSKEVSDKRLISNTGLFKISSKIFTKPPKLRSASVAKTRYSEPHKIRITANHFKPSGTYMHHQF